MHIVVFKKTIIIVMEKSQDKLKSCITAGGFSGYVAFMNAVIDETKFKRNVCYDWQQILNKMVTKTRELFHCYNWKL